MGSFFESLRLPLAKGSSTFLTKPLFNGLYTPFGSPVCGGQKPQGREDVTVLRCCFSKIIPSFFTIKEGSTSHLGLLPSGKKRKTALWCSEPLRYKVDGASKPSPNCAGWDRRGTTCYNLLIETTIFVPHCSIALRLSPLEWGCFLNILPFTGAK